MPRRIEIEIVGDERDLLRSFSRSSRAASSFNRDIQRLGRGALVGTGALGGLGRAAAFASTAFIGGAGFTFALRSASSAATNLAEQTSKSRVVFEQAAATVQSFAKDALGLAEDQALETASAFGALLTPLGVVGSEAASLSVRLTRLGVDLASFSNVPVADALNAIRSGLVGEVEPLRRFGILLSEARVQQEALRQTGKKNAAELTNQEKVLARVSLIFADSAQAAGDYQRTIGGLANQQRELQKNVRNLQIAIGRELNPVIADVVEGLNKWLSDSRNQQRVQDAITEAVRTGRDVVATFVDVMGDLRDILRPLVRGLGGTRNALELLLAAFVATKISGFSLALSGLSADLATATTRAGRLRGALTRLGRIGLIAIGIELLVNREPIQDALGPNGRLAALGKTLKQITPGGREIGRFNEQTGELIIGTEGAIRRAIELRDAWDDIATAIIRASSAFGAFVIVGKTLTAAAESFRRKFVPRTGAGATADQKFELPFRLQLQQARAEAADNQRLILNAARAIRDFLRRQIPHLSGERLLTAYGLLAQANATLAGAARDAAEKARDAAEKQKRAALEQKRKLEEARRKMAESVETFRQQIGELFAGPILQPSEERRKRALGVPGPDARTLVRDLRAQTAEFLRFQRDLQRLLRAGAPRGLVGELQQQGLPVAPQVRALLEAPRKVLQDFFRAFQAREGAARIAALVQLKTPRVNLAAGTVRLAAGGAERSLQGVRARPLVIHNVVELDGRVVAENTTRHQQRRQISQGVQRRGRYGGNALAL